MTNDELLRIKNGLNFYRYIIWLTQNWNTKSTGLFLVSTGEKFIVGSLQKEYQMKALR